MERDTLLAEIHSATTPLEVSGALYNARAWLRERTDEDVEGAMLDLLKYERAVLTSSA